MISVSEFKDVAQKATTIKLYGGVIFRWPLNSSPGSMMLASRGHCPSPPSERCDLELSELVGLASAFDFIGYRGQDAWRHYFVLPNAATICVPRADLDVCRLPIQLGMCLFVTFLGNQIRVADPITISLTQPESCQWALAW